MGEHFAVAGMDHVITIEQTPSTKGERTNDGEISRGHDQLVDPTEAPKNQSITIIEEVSTSCALQCKAKLAKKIFFLMFLSQT